ncbi:uncharacterized protein LOC130190214 [Pseudoliparis swirei]|uniref:uncharacterized protein LOC130190214 n=1 Tax=Pseudoliparis swirei TaxID=2059687 RepID=UPI0024BF09F4|nr:uncharacterized protein LOC130190214 [Pseudoliparis swirei]
MRRCVAAVVLLSLLSGGLSAPLSRCDSLVKPITLSKEDLLGRWLYIGGTSNLPGSRSVIHLLTSVWVNFNATAQSNVLELIQSQRIFGKCSSITFNMAFENSTLSLEQPFHLKEVYLPTSCSDCLVVYEDVTFGKDAFTSLMLFSRRQSVSPDVVEAFKTQAECLRMLTPIMIDTDYEICPVDASPTDGLSGIQAVTSLFEATMGIGVGLGLLDSFFDTFVN